MTETRKRPKVSILIPIYNVAKYLVQCLDSVVSQTLQDIEIFCINDGSTDASPEIIREYSRRDGRIVVIDKPNEGYGNSMNCGIAEMKGEYVGIVEPDDYVDLHMFEDLYNAAVSYAPKAQVVKSAYWRVMRDGKTKEFIYPSPHKGRIKPESQPFTMEQDGEMLFYHPSIWSAIYEKDFLDEYDIRFKEVPGTGWVDNPFFMQTLCHASRIAYVDKCYYYYREDNLDSSSNLKEYSIPFDRWNEMQDFLDNQFLNIPSILEAQACRAFAYIIGASKAANAVEHSDALKAEIKKMYSRMDERSVIDSLRISKRSKRKFLAAVNPNNTEKLAGGYLRHLQKEFFRTVKVGGLDVALYRVRAFLAKM